MFYALHKKQLYDNLKHAPGLVRDISSDPVSANISPLCAVPVSFIRSYKVGMNVCEVLQAD